MLVIPRIIGGIGNQLFSYCASRRFAIKNNAELALDDISGFKFDHQYKRHYQLDHFNISARKATFFERLEPFSKLRRFILKKYNRNISYENMNYVTQDSLINGEQILNPTNKKWIYLEGYWQNENYFKDIEDVIRDDLQITPPQDETNTLMSKKIQSCNSVALHIRFFDDPESVIKSKRHISYYADSISLIESKIDNPHYFIFSDRPDMCKYILDIPINKVTYIDHNQGDIMAYADMWLMSLCKHFIIANSTFSWWGAWLGSNNENIVICPKIDSKDDILWTDSFLDSIPMGWIRI